MSTSKALARPQSPEHAAAVAAAPLSLPASLKCAAASRSSMKWNFECESEWRDYVHDRIAERSNGFAPFNKQATMPVRYRADGFE
jgi:hypothetical protein